MKKYFWIGIAVVVLIIVGDIFVSLNGAGVFSDHGKNGQHELRIVVDVISMSTGREVPTSVNIHVDVTVADGRHGINKKTGEPYPWDGIDKTPTGSIITYWENNGTNFLVMASTVEPLKPGLIIRCRMYKDNLQVSDPAASQDRRLGIDGKSMGVQCMHHEL